MSKGIDWQAETAKGANHTQASLIALARKAGYTVNISAGKGSHAKVTGHNLTRPVTIQNTMYRAVAVKVIKALKEGLE